MLAAQWIHCEWPTVEPIHEATATIFSHHLDDLLIATNAEIQVPKIWLKKIQEANTSKKEDWNLRSKLWLSNKWGKEHRWTRLVAKIEMPQSPSQSIFPNWMTSPKAKPTDLEVTIHFEINKIEYFFGRKIWNQCVIPLLCLPNLTNIPVNRNKLKFQLENLIKQFRNRMRFNVRYWWGFI